MIIHDQGGLGFRIERIWAFIAVHSDGDEGIVAAKVGGEWMPLIAADQDRLEIFRPIAEKISQASGKPVILARFEQRVDEVTIEP